MNYLVSCPYILIELYKKNKAKNDNLFGFGQWTKDPCILKLLENKKVKFQEIDMSNIHFRDNFSNCTDEIYKSILLIFKSIYKQNKYQSINLEYLVGPFVLTLSSIISYRLYEIENINIKKIDFYVTNKFNFQSICSFNFEDFVYKSFDHRINGLIYSEILRSKKIKIKYIETDQDKNKPLKKYSLENCKSRLQFNKKLFFIHELGFSNLFDKFFKILTWSFQFKEKINYKKKIVDSFRIEQFQLLKKKNLNKNFFLNNNIDVFFNIVKWLTPLSYFENYKYYQNQAKLLFSNHVKYIFCSSSYYYDDYFKHWLNIIDLKFSKLIIFQHGGVYGMYKNISLVEKIENKFSKFRLTWGWSSSQNEIKFISTKHFFKKKIYSLNKRKTKVTILCCRHKFYSRGERWESHKWQNDYLEILVNLSKIKLINKLDYINFRLHPKSQDIGIDLKKYLLKKNTKLAENNFDGEKYLEHSLSLSKITIATINSTSFLDSINQNVPTILFYWDHKINPPSRILLEILPELIKVKLIHKNFKSLNEFLITTDIDKWWKSKEVQEALCIFKDKYLNTKFSNLSNFYTIFKK